MTADAVRHTTLDRFPMFAILSLRDKKTGNLESFIRLGIKYWCSSHSLCTTRTLSTKCGYGNEEGMSPLSSDYIMKAIRWLSGFGNNEDQKWYNSRITSFSPYLSPNHSFRVSLRTADLFPRLEANSIHGGGFATPTTPPLL